LGKTPIEQRKTKFGDEDMSFEVFKNIVDQVSEFKHSTLRIHSVGEPLMWKHLGDGLDYVKKKGVISWIFTNAVTKNRHLLEALVRNCSIVEISVNSIDPDNYSSTKGTNAFELVKSNIEYLHNFIAKNHLKTRLIVSRVQSDDQDYDTAFVSYWKKSGWLADAFIRSYHSYNGLVSREGEKKTKPAQVPCQVHWSRFNIDCDGSVVICFNELFKGPSMDRSWIIGDTTKESIKDIWHGKKLTAIRKAQFEGDNSLITFTKQLPCLNCQYCQPLDTKRQTSEYQVRQLKC